jgi:single-strand DNA-binding protein
MKNITIAGRIGKSAETRRTQAGDAVTSFSVAVDDRSQKEKTTLWFDCSLWGKRGDALAQYLTKGASVTVAGDLGQRTHEGKTYLTVRANDVTLQGGKQEERAAPKPEPMPQGGFSAALDDDIPFAPEFR